MDILFFNAGWMLYNIALALIAIIFGLLTYQTKSVFLKIIFGFIWILFLPNTTYILTDIQHVFEDLPRTTGIIQVFLIIQYTLLMISGIVTFLYGLYPLEKMLKASKKTRHQTTLLLILVNFLVAFGIVLGRVQRLNSWDVFFDVPKVISNSLNIISSTQLVLLFLFFAAVCNVLYFCCKSFIVRSWNSLR